MASESDRSKLQKIGFLKKPARISDDKTLKNPVEKEKAKSRWGKAITGVRAVRIVLILFIQLWQEIFYKV